MFLVIVSRIVNSRNRSRPSRSQRVPPLRKAFIKRRLSSLFPVRPLFVKTKTCFHTSSLATKIWKHPQEVFRGGKPICIRRGCSVNYLRTCPIQSWAQGYFGSLSAVWSPKNYLATISSFILLTLMFDSGLICVITQRSTRSSGYWTDIWSILHIVAPFPSLSFFTLQSLCMRHVWLHFEALLIFSSF